MTPSLPRAPQVERIYIQFADNGNIRKWQHEPFDGGTEYVAADCQSKPQALPDGYGDYWHSIDTAPEDQYVILATSGDHVGEALMLIDEDTGQQKWTWAGGPVSKFHAPLGWRPMPSPIRAPVLSDNRPGGFDGPTGAE
jgi:hypothetical protein